MTWEFISIQLTAYMLVFCRMGGLFFFNPIFSRKNMPNTMRIALVIGITLILTPTVSGALNVEITSLSLLIMMCKELMVGVACGLVFQFFFYMLFFAGDVIDMGFGLSMAKVFDPGTNVQMSLSGNLFQLIFIMYFFTTDSHLLMIKLFASSYDIVTIGAVQFGGEVGRFATELFIIAFNLAVRLVLPFMAASFILEIAMGILMKLIPQINVFSIHFQFKIILGLGLLFLFAVPVTEFMNLYIDNMFVSIGDLLGMFQ